MRSAFVSHSTSDDRYVAEMESFLRAAGFDEVFNDVSAIEPDEKFWPKIEEGITNCETLVVVITFASNASEWVKREVEYARGLSKKIIPVWIEDCPIPPIFADRDVIDFRPRTRQERRFEISRIVKYAPAELIGREDETKLLNDAWEKVLRIENGRPHLLTFVALGGEGKTSLVAKWAAELANQDWPGCDAAFAWSFYSQGTREQVAASSDLFLKEGLTFFGDEADKAFAASPAGAFEKGQRLARIVGQRRILLILDGLEPLQYAPGPPHNGMLNDQGIAALLKGLAAASHGLCVITTRYSLPDLRAFWQTTALEVKLPRLSRAAGVHLLQSFGVKGSLLRNIPFQREQVNEFEKLVEDVKGHALTLNLLGTYLRDAHAGDIRKRDLVKLEEADAEEQGGHAFRVMEAYELEFEREGDKGQRALALLRLLGLFDRPVTSGCLGALLQAPAIPELTESLVDVSEAQRNLAFKRLEDARLLAVHRDVSGALDTLDAHPLLREYFGRQLRAQRANAWRAAHRRLYEYLCSTTPDKPAATLEDLQPLYQAVGHGCYAGLHQEAFSIVGLKRIRRGDAEYPTRKLGAFGSGLGAIACYFEIQWSRLTPCILNEADKAWLFTGASYCLRALGRLTEALEPMRIGLDMRIEDKNWRGAAVSATYLCELVLTLGDVIRAMADAELFVTYADNSGDAFLRWSFRATHADAMHQAGHRAEAELRFHEAEEMQIEVQPVYPLKHSLPCFQYCDFRLSDAERGAWRQTQGSGSAGPQAGLIAGCRAVAQRANRTLTWLAQYETGFLDNAIGHLTLGRAALYAAILETGIGTRPMNRDELRWRDAAALVDTTLSCLRRASDQDILPLGLLTRSWLRSLTGTHTGPDSAQADLDEAWEIAERGPMRLHLADIHLHRARLFFREAQYPWESPAADLASSEKLINECGYHRRDEELADAKAAILSR